MCLNIDLGGLYAFLKIIGVYLGFILGILLALIVYGISYFFKNLKRKKE